MVMPFGQNKNTLDTTIYLIGNVVNMDVTILFLSPDADHIFLFGCVGRTVCVGLRPICFCDTSYIIGRYFSISKRLTWVR